MVLGKQNKNANQKLLVNATLFKCVLFAQESNNFLERKMLIRQSCIEVHWSDFCKRISLSGPFFLLHSLHIHTLSKIDCIFSHAHEKNSLKNRIDCVGKTFLFRFEWCLAASPSQVYVCPSTERKEIEAGHIQKAMLFSFHLCWFD